MSLDLQAEVSSRRSILNSLRTGRPLPLRPREYAVTLDWPYRALGGQGTRASEISSYDAEFAETLERAVGVDHGTIFYVDGIDFSLSLVATNTDTSVAAEFTVSPSFRGNNFGFRWNVRDSGTNRDWSDAYLDEYNVLSGFETGLRFKDGVGIVSGGANIIVSLVPKFAYNNQDTTQFTSITKVRYRFSFVGVERKVAP